MARRKCRTEQGKGYLDVLEWQVYGGSAENIRYSGLRQINRQNVDRLRVAWTFDSGDAFPGSELQCNPIVVNGVLYATTPKVNVVALDAATGRLLWRFDPNEGRRVIGKMRNRGVTYWSDGRDRRIFVAVRQYLYSLNAATGKPDPSFGEAGRIDLRDNLGREPRNAVSLTTPPVVYKDLIITGSMMGETLPASPGDVRAYEAEPANSAGLSIPFLTPASSAMKLGPRMLDVQRSSQ